MDAEVFIYAAQKSVLEFLCRVYFTSTIDEMAE